MYDVRIISGNLIIGDVVWELLSSVPRVSLLAMGNDIIIAPGSDYSVRRRYGPRRIPSIHLGKQRDALHQGTFAAEVVELHSKLCCRIKECSVHRYKRYERLI